jgi:hypothetical protein
VVSFDGGAIFDLARQRGSARLVLSVINTGIATNDREDINRRRIALAEAGGTQY